VEVFLCDLCQLPPNFAHQRRIFRNCGSSKDLSKDLSNNDIPRLHSSGEEWRRSIDCERRSLKFRDLKIREESLTASVATKMTGNRTLLENLQTKVIPVPKLQRRLIGQ
jgi:hypothetical protein